MLDSSLQSRLVDIDNQDYSLVERDSEGLSPAHSATSTGEGEGPRQCATKMLTGDGPESFIGPLKDPLGADINPGPRRHLAVHRQPECF